MGTIYYTYIHKNIVKGGHLSSLLLKTLDLKEPDSLSESRVIEKKLIFKALSLVVEVAFKKPVDQFRVHKEENGKPWLHDQESKKKYFISYSHSKEGLALAVSESVFFGLDLESTNRFKSHKSYKKWLTKSELSLFEEAEYSEVLACQVWTRKEALTKMFGLGYKLEFKMHSVYPLEIIDFLNEKVAFKSLNLGSMYLSFAYKHDEKTVAPKIIKLD